MRNLKVVVLIVLMLCIVLLGAETSVMEPSNFNDSNAGSEENPYLIANLSNLRWLSETNAVWGDSLTTTHFVQTQHIDAQDSQTWNDGIGFKAIGYAELGETALQNNPFYGVYDGGFYTVSNLYQRFDSSQMKSSGMFGSIENAVVKNLSIENADIVNNYFTGIISGKVSNSVIEKIKVSGTVTSTNGSAGCVGVADNSTISQIAAFITLSVEDNGGGIVSLLINSSLEDSYLYGTIDGVILGGLVNNVGYNSIVRNSYFAGTSYSSFSGLVAFSTHPLSTIESTLALSEQNIPIINTNNGEQTNTSIVTLEQVQSTSFLINLGWSFETIWGIDASFNEGLPYLLWENRIPTSNSNTEVIESAALSTNYPNPFNPKTTIKYEIPQAGKVELTVYNIKGQEINTLIKEHKSAGNHQVVWNGKDSNGKKVASGTYLYRVKVGGKEITKKMVLIK